MLISALVAFGHFFAFFALTAALVVQLALLSEKPTLEIARRIQRADRVSGLAAVLLLVFGLLRVFYYAKGADFYFNNSYFIAKVILFISVGLISIYPTLTYSRWTKVLKQGRGPELTEKAMVKLRFAIHSELVGIGLIIFCASMMARGLGYSA